MEANSYIPLDIKTVEKVIRMLKKVFIVQYKTPPSTVTLEV
jgi:hypothetical protein